MGCLDDIRLASPCPARWSQMKGDDRVRFCGQCAKNVYDFSQLTEAEITALLARDGKVCARLWRRPDGKLLTADCPVGAARARARLLAAVFTALSFLLGFLGVRGLDALGRAMRSLSHLEGGGLIAAPIPSHGAEREAMRGLEGKNLNTFGQNNAP